MNRRIRYYVLEFTINNNPNLTSSMCVLGYYKPKIEEAQKFWKEDCELYPDETLTNIYKISFKKAHEDFYIKKDNRIFDREVLK